MSDMPGSLIPMRTSQDGLALSSSLRHHRVRPSILAQLSHFVLFRAQSLFVTASLVMFIVWGVSISFGLVGVVLAGLVNALIAMALSIPIFWLMHHNQHRLRAAHSLSYMLFCLSSIIVLYDWTLDLPVSWWGIGATGIALFMGAWSAQREIRLYLMRAIEGGKTEELFSYYLDLSMMLITIGALMVSLVAFPMVVAGHDIWMPISMAVAETMFVILFVHRWYAQQVIRWPLILLTGTVGMHMSALILYTQMVQGHMAHSILPVIIVTAIAPLFPLVLASKYGWLARDYQRLPRPLSRFWMFALMLVATLSTVSTFVVMPPATHMWWAIAPVLLVVLMMVRLIALTDARDRERTALRSLQELSKRRSDHDVVTDLLNRRGVEQWLANHFATQQVDIGLIFIKINGIKSVNDMSGYLSGDQALYYLGQRLVNATPANDLVGRMDGNIFVIAMTHANDIGTVEFMARRAIDLVTRPIVCEDRINSYLGANAYVVLANEQDKVSELLSIADAAVNQLFTQDDSSVVKMHTRMLSDVQTEFSDIQRLRTALEKNEFELFYQPVIDIQHNVPTGFEALARWSTSNTNPGIFIPQIENAGLADMFGRWVLNEATSWAAQHGTDIAINISPRHLHNPSFYTDVVQALEYSQCPPERVILEITERTSIQNQDILMKTLAAIRKLGVRIAVDDFGTGEFSLLQLSQLPLDILKIDRSFVIGITHQTGDRAMVESLIHIAKGLGLSMIAEGIENHEVAEVLSSLLCEEAQGYLWSKPMSSDLAAQWWADNKAASVTP